MMTEEEKDGMTERREEARERKNGVVREFLRELDDKTLFKVAFLYTRGLDDKAVMKEMGFGEDELKQVKGRLAIGLKLAGVKTRE